MSPSSSSLVCTVVLSTICVVFVNCQQSCYEEVNNARYYAIKDDCMGRTRDEANYFCYDHYGTELAAFWGPAQNRNGRRLRDSLPNGEDYDAWIGATDVGSEGDWRWGDSGSLRYRNWFNGEPNNYGGNQHCAIMGAYSDRWDDQNCMYNIFIL